MGLAILGILVSIFTCLAAVFFHIWWDRTARVIYWNALPPQVMVADADDLEITIGNSNIRNLTKYTFELENRGRQDIEWTGASHFYWYGPGTIWRAKVAAAADEKNEAWTVNLDYKRKPQVNSEDAALQADFGENQLAARWGALRKGSTHRVEVYCESDSQWVGKLDAAFPNTSVQPRLDFVTVGKDTRRGVRTRVWVAVIAGFGVSLQAAVFLHLDPVMAILAGYGYTSILLGGIYGVYPVGQRSRGNGGNGGSRQGMTGTVLGLN